MRNFVILILVALLAIAILLFIFNPEILEKIWLWIVGLIGFIISAIRNAIKGLVGLFKKDEEESTTTAASTKTDPSANLSVSSPQPASTIPATTTNDRTLVIQEYEDKINELEGQILILENQLKKVTEYDQFQGTTLTVLRYFDDGATTLGLLFLNDKFFCYTLEDTYREVKIKKETRIPQGTYVLGFNRHLTGLTKTYRKSRPWFEYHLHVKDVPNYQGVYIHVGNTIKDTEGCLLVADSINSSSAKRSIYNSRETFKRLYLTLKPIIDSEKPVRIKYYNEDWFKRFKLKKIVA